LTNLNGSTNMEVCGGAEPGATLFVVAAGEVKKRDEADPDLLEFAVKAYKESQKNVN